MQLVKVGFGNDSRVQRWVIGALVRRAPWLECAVLIARDSRVGSRGWRGRRAGGARRPLHGVHSACRGREGEGDGGDVGMVGGRAEWMRRPFSVNTLAPASISESIRYNDLFDLQDSSFFSFTHSTHLDWTACSLYTDQRSTTV